MGVATGIDLDKLIALGHRAEQSLGRQFCSSLINAGRVPHHGIVYDKEEGIVAVKE